MCSQQAGVWSLWILHQHWHRRIEAREIPRLLRNQPRAIRNGVDEEVLRGDCSVDTAYRGSPEEALLPKKHKTRFYRRRIIRDIHDVASDISQRKRVSVAYETCVHQKEDVPGAIVIPRGKAKEIPLSEPSDICVLLILTCYCRRVS